MSTFEGRQITQLICPKPIPISPTTTASTPHGSPVVGEKNTGGESDSTLADGDNEAGEGSSKTRGGGYGERASENEEASPEIAEMGFDTRERGEAFMCISLEVKNMVGVEDALKKLTEKEIIEGYAWDDEVREQTASGLLREFLRHADFSKILFMKLVGSELRELESWVRKMIDKHTMPREASNF